MNITTLMAELGRTGRQAARTWGFLTPNQRRQFFTAIAMMALVGFLSARIPLVLGGLVDGMLAGHIPNLAAAGRTLAILAAVYVAREGLQVVRKIMVERTCTDVESDATVRAVSSLLHADLAHLSLERSGTLNGRLHRSVEGLVRLLKLSFLDLFPALFGAIFALIASVQKNPELGLVMSLIVPIGLAIIMVQLASQRGIRVALLRVKEKVDGTLVEQLGGIESVRAAHTVDLEVDKIRATARDLAAKEFKHHRAMAFFDAGKSLNEGSFHIIVLAFAIALALAHKISAGDILAFSMLFMAVITPMREVHRIVDEAHESGIQAAEFFEMVGMAPDASFLSREEGDIGEWGTTAVECSDLTVAYKGAAADMHVALEGVSLNIRRGAIIGLAGPSGSGKTTFVKALLRLTAPASGRLTVAGRPIDRLSRAAIGRLFGFVSQEPFLFSGTVFENIAYGRPGTTSAEVIEAATAANIAEEIEAWPEGYDRVLTERGRNLSGGQRQRIALARVFLQNPPILILDEATAALDNTNEREVMDAISRAAVGRTVFMVAHRLTSLKNTDWIYVFKSGGIVEEGKFDDLAQRHKGEFASLLMGQRAA